MSIRYDSDELHLIPLRQTSCAHGHAPSMYRMTKLDSLRQAPQNPCTEEKTMTNINGGRVVLGGLLAGLIINFSETILNIPVLGEQMDAAMKARNLPAVGSGAIAVFTFGGFVLSVLLVWLY